MKKDSFELGFEVREGEEIPQAGGQRIPDGWGNETERKVASRFEIAFKGFQKKIRSMIAECVKCDTWREKLKGKTEVYRRDVCLKAVPLRLTIINSTEERI